MILTESLGACGSGATTNGTGGQLSDIASGDTLPAAEILVDGEIGGEITVSAYNSMTYKAFLEDAARLFEEKYPGTKVTIETFSVMPEIKTDGQGMVMASAQDDSQNRADYINRVNTALMSGGGADILAMDVLPFYKYADSGQLENLTDYMQADLEFNKSDYRMNILDAVEYKNGIWFLPLDYTFDYYIYDSTLLTGSAASGFGTGEKFMSEELISLAEPFFDGNSKIFNKRDYTKSPGPGCMWDILLTENYTSFVDIENNTANFNDGNFSALLESIVQYSEKGYIPKGATGRSDAGAMMQMPGEGTGDRYFYKPKNISGLIALFTRNFGLKMTSMGEGDTMTAGDNEEIAGIAAADGSVPFDYNQAYGIRSNSKNKGTSWAFLKFLLSEEIQSDVRLSQPILNSAREKKTETIMTSFIKTQAEQELDPALLNAIKECNQAVEKLSGQINAYVIRDTVIDDMIAAEVQYFFEGNKTSAEVAGTLQNKVTLYLNE